MLIFAVVFVFLFTFLIRFCSHIRICIWILCLRELYAWPSGEGVPGHTHSIWCDLIRRRRRRLRFSRRDLFNSKSVDILFMSVCAWHHRTLRPSVRLSILVSGICYILSHSLKSLSLKVIAKSTHEKKHAVTDHQKHSPRHYNTGLSATKGA